LSGLPSFLTTSVPGFAIRATEAHDWHGWQGRGTDKDRHGEILAGQQEFGQSWFVVVMDGDTTSPSRERKAILGRIALGVGRRSARVVRARRDRRRRGAE